MIGRQISHFYIIRALGSGGMGVVYEAQDTRLPRSVAIKVLRPALTRDADALKRFKREARLAASLNHPNICTILDVDEGAGVAFIAMEMLQGASLKARLATTPLSLDEILSIACQVADALGTAHDHGIMHRDLTPGNIFLAVDGLVKLLDFGLAKHCASLAGDEAVSDDLTTSGAVVGTIPYMAPEQFGENAAVDYRCDLFALGAVLYQLVTGARPFEAASKDDVIALIQGQPHLPVHHLAPETPIQLQRVIDKLLAKSPDDRYQTAWAAGAELALLRRHAAAGSSSPPRGPGDATIAVLPFAIIGETTSVDEHFAAGLAEEVRSRLSRIRHVRVAPRTSTQAVPGRSVRDIAVRLGVETVLEGSIRQADGRLRIVANLLNAHDEQAIRPALTLERRGGELLTLQDEFAREIADAIAPCFVRIGGKRYTHDPEAYHAFKRGQHAWRTCFAGGWRSAIDHFQHAVARDPQFALAHVALADAYNFLGLYSLMKPHLAFAVASQSAERALAIEDSLAIAHIQLALARFGGEWDWEGAEQAFRRALHLEPANPLAHIYYSWLLMLLGRDDAAFAEVQAGYSLAPSSRLVRGGQAQTLYLGRRYDEAIAACDECLRFDANYVFALHLRGLCFLAQSVHREAVSDLERAATLAGRAPFYLGLLGLCYGELGMRENALALIGELDRQRAETYVPSQCYVFIYAGLGEPERALKYQEQAYVDGASPLNYLTPSVRRLYALDPHNLKRLEQMRLIL
jgi:TolB-like protein/tRNA A-37 threonylcarbamoyl transferase component Bud32/Tfp pilus assembly protein PilF